MNDAGRCPTPEQLAAFVAGELDGDELMMVAEHLRTCEDCRLTVADAVWIDRLSRNREESAREPIVRPRRRWPWWLAAAAAAIAGIAYFAPSYEPRSNGARALHELAEAAPHQGRALEPRVSGGFPWAPLRSALRGGSTALDAAQMKFVGAAGDVLQQTANDPSPEARHAAAVAHLVAGRAPQAAALLGTLAPASSDATVWNDLAAARYAAAVQLGQPSELARALAAADAALQLRPDLPEALFNRALIVERLGLRDQARAAWERYLASDPSSPWSTEARQHLRELAATIDFRRRLDRDYDRLSENPAEAQALATAFPQDARVWGESNILGRWADASKRNDATAAARHVRLARAFAEALAKEGGDRMLLDAVAAVDTASRDGRAVLVDAHAALRDAQKVFIAGRPADAATLFDAAAKGFAKAGSPMSLVARYFFANTLYDRGDLDESRRQLAELAATAPPAYPAHAAQVQWQLGLAEAAAGQWGAAIRTFEQSIATFDRLGEKRYAASVREILAEVYDRLGEPAQGWEHRLTAMGELGLIEDTRLEVAVQAAARAAAIGHDWPVSLSFLRLVLEMAQHGGDELLIAETHLFRAGIEEKLGRGGDARSDVQLAGASIQRLRDPAVRERAEADRMAVDALLARSPQESIALLSRAIDYHGSKGRRMFLPDMYLARGRAERSLAQDGNAAADFEAGIAELERQRASGERPDEQWGVFSSTTDLFDEAVSLSLAGERRGAAFEYAERERAFATADAIASPPTRTSKAVAGDVDVVLVEYAALPTALITFVVDHGKLRTVQRPIQRTVLTGEIEQIAKDAQSARTDRFRELARLLYDQLIEPVDDAIAGARTIVFVPDATLSSVPFGALVDRRGQYVVDRHGVIVAPSAAVFATLAAKVRPAPAEPRLLVIAGPSDGGSDMPQLTATAQEASAVAAAYHLVARPDHADPSTFESLAADADVIHFAGHAVDADGGSEAALLSTAGAARLDARTIAGMRLPRTRVVVLAACATGRSRARPGDAGVSVAQAFLAAGASSVIATLWPIEDRAAAEFFPRLHHHLARGLSPAEALRATQLEWIHGRNAPPGFWAAVQVIGS